MQGQRAFDLPKVLECWIDYLNQCKRLLERNQKKDSSYRRKLQKKIQSVAEGNAELCIEFPEMDESHIKAILANPCRSD